MREMKDSGIEWIGEIPKEWDLIKCKYVTEVYTGNSIKDEEKGLYEDPVDSIPYISTKDIDATFNSVAYDNGLFIKKIDTSFVRANKGDTLMCIEGGSAGRKKAILDRTVCFVNKLCCFHPTRINPVYLFYILNSPHYEEEFSVNISGLIGGVSKGKLMNFILPYPCYDTQHRIADYLDDKCGKIDRYIEQQKQVIEKLKAYKQSVITEAVTKGLDPTVPMKDSGVEWIGEIPERWEVVKFKNLLKMKKNALRVGPFGSQLRSDDFVTNGYPVYNQRTVLDNDFHSFDIFIDEKKFKTLKDFSVEPDDCLITTRGTIGKMAVVPRDISIGIIHPCVMKFQLSSEKIISDFLQYIFNYTNMALEQLLIASNSTTIPVIYSGTLKEVLLPLPRVKEQIGIISFLDKMCISIDSTIEKKQTLIEKLTEYKKSLIYEVVTGKKEV